MPTSLARRLVKRAVQITDGWYNALTGLGWAARDKTLNGVGFEVDMLSDSEAEQIYRGDDMAARIIDKPVGAMLRQGFTLQFDVPDQTDDQRAELSRAVMAKLGDLKAKSKFSRALRYERAYGGGGILIGADDGALSMRQPLNLNAIRSVRWLTVLHKRELVPVEWYAQPGEPNYGEPSVYRIQPRQVMGSDASALQNAEIHETRLILFKGIEVSEWHLANNNGFGDSVLIRCNRVISQYNQSWSSAAILLADFAQAVIKIKGLAELLAANDCDAVVNRATGVDIARSVARAVIIDSEEEYERKVTPINGMPEMLQQFALRLSAAAEMPVSLLLGQAPAGMNATGEADIRAFYDTVAEAQTDKLRPPLEYLIKIILLAKDGPTRGLEPPSWEVAFNSLWQPAPVEEAEIRLKTAQADDIWLSHSVISPEECATSRFGGAAFSSATVIDLNARRRMGEISGQGPSGEGSADPSAEVKKSEIPITPTDFASIVKVNEVRVKAGYGPLTTPEGTLDPDGLLTVAAFQAKHAPTVAAANAATSGETTPKPSTPAPPAAPVPNAAS